MEVRVKKEDPEKRNKKISFTFAQTITKGDKGKNGKGKEKDKDDGEKDAKEAKEEEMWV